MEEYIKLKLTSLNKPMVNSGYPFILTTCLNPHHDDKNPSFSVNLDTGAGKCFSCGFSVNSDYWVSGKLSDEEIMEINRIAKLSALKDKFKKESETTSVVFLPPKDAAVEDGWRGLSKETIKNLNIYICQTGHYKNRVVFPMENKYGDVVAFNTRALEEEAPKYKYSKGIQVNKLIYPPLKRPTAENSYVVLVEGIMDAISMYQEGIPALLNFGVNNTIGSEKIGELLSSGITTIYLGLDNDEAGLKGTKTYLESNLSEYFEVKLASELPELKLFYESGCKDYNDYIQKYSKN